MVHVLLTCATGQSPVVSTVLTAAHCLERDGNLNLAGLNARFGEAHVGITWMYVDWTTAGWLHCVSWLMTWLHVPIVCLRNGPGGLQGMTGRTHKASALPLTTLKLQSTPSTTGLLSHTTLLSSR